MFNDTERYGTGRGIDRGSFGDVREIDRGSGFSLPGGIVCPCMPITDGSADTATPIAKAMATTVRNVRLGEDIDARLGKRVVFNA